MYFLEETKATVLDDFVDQLITPPVKQYDSPSGLLVKLDDGRSITVIGSQDQTSVFVNGNSVTPDHFFNINDERAYRKFKAWALTY